MRLSDFTGIKVHGSSNYIGENHIQQIVRVSVAVNQTISDALEDMARELEQPNPDVGRLDRTLQRLADASGVVAAVVSTVLQLAH